MRVQDTPELDQPKSLLIVEDNPEDARLLREMLHGQGASEGDMVQVDTMAAAEEYAANHTVNAIFLDLGLPDASGIEAVRRAHAMAPHVPLVVVTGLDDAALATEAIQAGAQDYIVKGQVGGEALSRTLRYATERKSMEETLASERDQLEAAFRVLDRRNDDLEAFSYSVSHDLKEPLRAIEGFSSILVSQHAGKMNSESRELLQQIVDASNRMRLLIDDLLALSQVSRETNATTETTETQQVADEIVRNLAPVVKERNGKLTVGHLPPVSGDRARVGQIFQNLITNGLKYNQNKIPTVEVGCLGQDGTQITFFFKDNGIGIDPQYHQSIFGLFQRLHSRDLYEGNGAGLAIVKRAVEAISGKIWLESSEGQGSTFFVSLPAPERPAQPDAQPTASAPTPTSDLADRFVA